jgi:hypothetical protein
VSWSPAARWKVILTAGQAAGQAGWWAALAASLPAALSGRGAGHLALVTAAWAGPAVLSPLAGRAIDALGPRVVGTGSWLGAALAAAWVTATPQAGLAILLAALAVLSACQAIAMAAGHVVPTWHPQRPDRARAGIWLLVAQAIPVLAGPLGGTSLLAWAGFRAAWLMVTALFTLGALGGTLIPAARPEPAAATAGTAPGSETKTAILPIAPVLSIAAGMWIVNGTVTSLAPLYVRTVLHSPLVAYGWALTAFAAGGLAAMVVLCRDDRLIRSSRGVAWAALAATCGEWVFTSSSLLPVCLAGAALWGACAGTFTVSCRAAIESAVPLARHGRAISGWLGVVNAAKVLPLTVITPVVGFAGLRTVLAGTCTLGTACALAYLTRVTMLSRIRHSRTSADASPPPAPSSFPSPG